MRTFVALGLVGLLGCFSSETGAHAADLVAASPPPVYAPPPAPVFSWTGFYIGINGGYGWGHNPFTSASSDPTTALVSGGINSEGYVLGGHAGYNWQHGAIVGGLELDMDDTGIKNSASAAVTTPGTGSSSASISDTFDYLGSARGRVGVLAGESVLLYGTGGLGFGRFSRVVSNTTVVTGPFGFTDQTTDFEHSTTFGWVAGGGVETKLGDFAGTALLVRAEYLHYDFGSGTSSSSASTGVGFSSSTTGSAGHITVDVARGGLSAKF